MSEKKSILAKLAQAANRLEMPLMLIGAGARDFWIEHCKLPVSHVRTVLVMIETFFLQLCF